jgi:hypothetical protein
MSRDDFTQPTIQLLAKRAGFRCSNPDCRRPTSGPGAGQAAVNLGVAAHITAASRRGPRFDELLPGEARTSADNGIWLCQQCSRLVDADASGHSVATLQEWKAFAEAAALIEMRGYEVVRSRSFSALERKLPELVGEMREDLLKKPLTREIIALSRKWTYNPGAKPYFAYYFEDHDDLLSKLHICQNYGAIRDAKYNNVDRFNLSEDFVDYLLHDHSA